MNDMNETIMNANKKLNKEKAATYLSVMSVHSEATVVKQHHIHYIPPPFAPTPSPTIRPWSPVSSPQLLQLPLLVFDERLLALGVLDARVQALLEDAPPLGHALLVHLTHLPLQLHQVTAALLRNGPTDGPSTGHTYMYTRMYYVRNYAPHGHSWSLTVTAAHSHYTVTTPLTCQPQGYNAPRHASHTSGLWFND